MIRILVPAFFFAAVLSTEASSLVETTQSIDDSAARLELARSMAQVPPQRAEALKIYRQIVGPGAASGLLRERRNLAMELGQFEVAARDFSRLDQRGELTPSETRWYVEGLKKLGRWRDAMSILERGLETPHAREQTVAAYVELARQAGLTDSARQRLGKLAAKYPHQPIFAIQAAQLAAKGNEPLVAEQILQRARAANPKNAAILIQLGDLALAAQKESAALDFYEQAVALAPGDLPLRRQAARTAHYAGRPEQARTLLAPVLSTPPGKNREAALFEESAARALEDRHPMEAACLFAQAARIEPGNLSHFYGVAGAQKNAGDLAGARDGYREILRQDPDQSSARAALENIEAGLRSRVRASCLFVDEDSPDRLTDVSRNIISTTFEMPVGDTFRFALGPQFWIESPGGVPSPSFAAGGTFLASWKPNAQWEFQLDYTYKNYATSGLRDTHTGGVASTWHPLDLLLVTAEYRRENVLPNRYAYAQHIQSGVARLSLDSPVNRWLELSASGALRHYSDANLEFESETAADFVLLQRPGRLVAELRGRFLTTENESVIQDFDGSETNIVHPYWTPRNYFRGLAGLFWDQPLGKRHGGGEAPFAYHAGLQTSLDTEGNPAIAFRGGVHGAIGSHLTVDLSGSIERSLDWNGASAFVSLEYAF